MTRNESSSYDALKKTNIPELFVPKLLLQRLYFGTDFSNKNNLPVACCIR